MPDDDNIIDVEAEEIEEGNDPSSGRSLERWRPAQFSEEWWEWVSPEIRAGRCQAHSSRTGLRCRRPAIAGGSVCRAHGGAAKHVKLAARARLDNAADRMVRRLLQLAELADDPVALKAVDSALDRTLGKPVQAIAVGAAEPKPYEEIFEGISTVSREESRAARGYAGVEAEHNVGIQTGSDGNSTDAGRGVPRSPATSYDSRPVSDEQQPDTPPATAAEASRQDAPPRGSRQRRFGRDSDDQPPTRHISGDQAYEVAGQLHRQLAIESPHKRYPRP